MELVIAARVSGYLAELVLIVQGQVVAAVAGALSLVVLSAAWRRAHRRSDRGRHAAGAG